MHARQLEIEGRHVAAIHPHERRQIAADAGVHVQPKPPRDRQVRQRLDRVDQAEGETGRRTHDHHRGRVRRLRHRRRIGQQVHERRAADLDLHDGARLVERRMCRARQDDVQRPLHAPVDAGEIAGGLQRHGDRVRAAGGDHAVGLVVAVQQAEAETDHLLFHPLQAGKGGGT